MINFSVLAESGASASTGVMDSSAVTFVVDTAKDIIGILTTPPLGTFITIGIIGAVVGLVAGIVRMAKNRG